MKKNNILIDDNFDFYSSIINALLFENTILRKKEKKVKLTKNEEIFDTFFISPSSMLRLLLKGDTDEKKEKNN